ncbi:aminotransferase class V-fold PLP-dependent enzyme [Tropicimonas aquimaris]|uniref:Aminotransferase class V-fold PLP-dependent enzyme n=1 Tax=Tropicimonas aquimaris TaxID=914152 RepID=A0ABW3IUX5_9RHOB
MADTAREGAGKEDLIALIRESVMGERDAIAGPFGPRPLIYVDYIASGRALSFVEDVILDRVLPVYGNTHTETSYTGREATALREEARRTIAEAVGADERHAVIFAGSGATAAIDRLVRGMGIEELARSVAPPVVFVGPYEHHSNDLPWRESGAVMERIRLDAAGQIDLGHLADRLAAHPVAPIKIGAFSAASNVTGVRTDLRAVARLLHAHGARFVCDFAAAAPYLPMRLDLEEGDPTARIDAIVYSSHKFIGGPGASGVLVADKALFTLARPGVTGGGTVSYVTADRHCYVSDIERREEAGTPGIVGDIRAGAVMALKQAVGAEEIERRETALVRKVVDRLSAAPGVEILGPTESDRIGVLSFNIRVAGRLLHYGFVVALLNDLFGIQARGGCSCAGPYAHHLLEIPADRAWGHEEAVRRGHGMLRPGWVRIGLNYFYDDETIDYLIEAILFIHENGLKFLPAYEADTAHGIWRHLDAGRREQASLGDFWRAKKRARCAKMGQLQQFLREAEDLARTRPLPVPRCSDLLHPQYEALRNYWMPQEMSSDAVGANAAAEL